MTEESEETFVRVDPHLVFAALRLHVSAPPEKIIFAMKFRWYTCEKSHQNLDLNYINSRPEDIIILIKQIY